MAEKEVKIIKKTEDAPEPVKEPNIAFVGDGEPFKFFNTAKAHITLPADQSKPFYHEKAELIIQTWPTHYKPVVSKGD